MADTIVLSTAGRNYNMSIGFEEGIKTGSAETNPYMQLLDGTTVVLEIELDPTNPLDTPAAGAATMRRVAGASWSGYDQNAIATGTMDGCKAFNRDNEEIFSGSVGLTGSDSFWEFDNLDVVSGSPIRTSAPVLTQKSGA